VNDTPTVPLLVSIVALALKSFYFTHIVYCYSVRTILIDDKGRTTNNAGSWC